MRPLLTSLLVGTLLAASIAGQPQKKPAKPITTSRGQVGDLLRKWYAEGTAAGNGGDYYDNRDRNHSGLRLSPYPQMKMVTYTKDQLKVRFDWAAQRVLLPHVTFGNSSTSASPQTSGSNIRTYYTQPRGVQFLYAQYRKNNLYIYPEHRDHDPGRNGAAGYGDLYPTNTPYLIASQGSSGSDQPFMRAMPYVLAAFRPEVKQKLVKAGLLMPTVQMILRLSNKHLAKPEEYLTGKAHPTVFEGKWVDVPKMIQLAHAIRQDDIPPMIGLKMVEEEPAIEGKDYFETGRTEKLADTPAVIARIMRGPDHERRFVVSAEESTDINGRALKYHWVVLRGKPENIKIKPLNDKGSKVEIRVAHHDRFLVDSPVPIESNRVDIGAFVHNGSYYSAPGFVTLFYVDHEDRTYDNGKLLEIGYGAGQARVSVARWDAFFDYQAKPAKDWRGRFWQGLWSEDERAAMDQVGKDYSAAAQKQQIAQEKRSLHTKQRLQAIAATKSADQMLVKSLDAWESQPRDGMDSAMLLTVFHWFDVNQDRQLVEEEYRTAQREYNLASNAANAILDRPMGKGQVSARRKVQTAARKVFSQPTFFLDHRAEIEKALSKANQSRIAAEQKRLIQFILLDKNGTKLSTIRAGKQPVAQRLTRYEHRMLQRFHASLLGMLYPEFLTGAYRRNFVDARISTAKAWRDVYHHDAKGRRTGWTRYDGKTAQEYNADGLVILEKDDRGRAVKARTVQYGYDSTKRRFWDRSLLPGEGKEIRHYEYAGPDDHIGKVVKREAVESK